MKIWRVVWNLKIWSTIWKYCYRRLVNGIVAGTDCDKIFSKRLVPNPSESWYVLPKWEKLLAIKTCNSYSFCKMFILCQYKLSGINYQNCFNKESVCELWNEIFGQNFENWTWEKRLQRMWIFTNFAKVFAPQKCIPLRYAPFSLTPVEQDRELV